MEKLGAGANCGGDTCPSIQQHLGWCPVHNHRDKLPSSRLTAPTSAGYLLRAGK